MRGQKLFNELVKGNGIEHPGRKGRNNSLIKKRNDCLIARYFYYCYFKNKCYEEVIRLLISEFFLSAPTILNIIQENTEHIIFLKQKSPTMYYFTHRWEHMKW